MHTGQASIAGAQVTQSRDLAGDVGRPSPVRVSVAAARSRSSTWPLSRRLDFVVEQVNL